MTANDSDAPRWMIWAVVLSQCGLLVLAFHEQINAAVAWVLP